jgi:hypothetical protein
MSNPSGDGRIFVSLASYRDAYLPFTINSALENASAPDRLTFGICWQADNTETLSPYLDDPRFRIRRYPYHASLGYGWARAEVQKLYDGEQYHLLIDSHTAFAKGWDQNLIDQLETKPSSKPLLTTSSPPFTLDEKGNVIIPWAGTPRDGVPRMTCTRIPPVGWLDIQMSEARKSEPDERTALICCNFVFTHGHWIEEVPEDPAMVNAGHEAALSLRTFTHGYDMFLPDRIQIWHLDYSNYQDGHRHKVWEAKANHWQAQKTKMMIRRIHTLFYNLGDVSDLGRFGPGQLRTVSEWAEAAGVDLSTPLG